MAVTEKKTRGGLREGSGRKLLNPKDKKTNVTIFVQQRFIDKHKTKEKLKEKIISAIEKGTL